VLYIIFTPFFIWAAPAHGPTRPSTWSSSSCVQVQSRARRLQPWLMLPSTLFPCQLCERFLSISIRNLLQIKWTSHSGNLFPPQVSQSLKSTA
jgi:hypothetical protein